MKVDRLGINSYNISIFDNIAQNNNDYQIYINSIYFIEIKDYDFSGGNHGLYLINCGNSTITNNTFNSHSNHGIALDNSIYLHLVKGDILELPYEDSSFSFVYSHHTVFHMVKVDIKRAIDEMKRVLVPGGLLFVNFPTMERGDRKHGKEVGKGEYESMHGSEAVIHSYFEDDEADTFFIGMNIVQKMKYQIFEAEGWGAGISMIEYITRKN